MALEMPMHLWQTMPLSLKDQMSLFTALGKADLRNWLLDQEVRDQVLWAKAQHKYKTRFAVGALYRRNSMLATRVQWMQVYKITDQHVIFRFIGANEREVVDTQTGYMTMVSEPDYTVMATQLNINLMRYTPFARCAKLGYDGVSVAQVLLPSFAGGMMWELSTAPDHMPHIRV
jgi:hypothetical protein